MRGSVRAGMTGLLLALMLMATASPAVADHEQNDGLDPATGAYVSVQFLYVYSWEGGWEPERDEVKVTPGESDLLTLYNGDYEFQAIGLMLDESPEEVLELAIEAVGVEGENVEVLGQDADAGVPNATVSYEGTAAGGREIQPMLGYLEVQEVSFVDGSGSAPLVVGLAAPVDQFEDAWESATTEIIRDYGFSGEPLFAGTPVFEGAAAQDTDEPESDDQDDDDGGLDINIGRADRDETDDAGETGEANENGYTDAAFGWSLTWDETWNQYADPEADGYLGLDNGVSFITIYAVEDYDGDSLACVEDQLAWLEELESASRVREMEIDGDPVAGGDSDAAFAAYEYRYAGDQGSSDLVNHYECYTLSDGESVLVITQTTALDSYETEAEPFAALLEGLSLEGDAPASDDEDIDENDDADSGGDTAATIASDEAREGDGPAMLLRADDLAELGLEGYGLALRSYSAYPLEHDFSRISRATKFTGGELKERFDEAGLERVNVVIYAYPDFESDGAPDLQLGSEGAVDLTSYVVVYLFEGTDEESAEAIYTLLTDTSQNDDVEVVEGTQTFGDESTLTRLEWFNPEDEGDEQFQTINVTFRTGSLVGEVRLELPSSGEEPAVEQIEALAERFMERIEATRAGEMPGLSNLVLRFDGEGVTPFEQRYSALNGDYDELAGVQADRNAQTYEEVLFAPVHMYTNRQYYSADPLDTLNGVEVRSTLFVYEDDAAAGDYMASIAESSQQSYVEREAPALGDEALAYTAPDSADRQWSHVYVRAGNVVIRIQVGALTLPPDDAVDDLVAEQIACLEAGECEPRRVPRDLRALDQSGS